MRNFIKRTATVLAIAGTMLGVTATAAQARSYNCSVNGASPILPNKCQTNSVGAYSDHSVYISVAAYNGCQFDYKVRDIANNKVVYSGRAQNHSKWIFGLYSFYRLELARVGSRCGGTGVIQGV